MDGEHLSFCRICAAGCGIVVAVDGDRVLRVRGDAGHPVSRGYTCAKGRALPAFHHDPRRLDAPTVDGATTTWDVAIDDLGARIAALTAEHGPDAVGGYLATGLASDFAGWCTAERLLARLGTRQRYTPVTVDNAAVLRAAELVTGSTRIGTVWEPAGCRLLLLVGTNPVVSHGYGTTLADPVARLRELRDGGGRLWVLDPRRTETAALADRHLAVRPGTDHLVLAWLVRELLTRGADRDELAAHTDAADVARLRGALEGFTADRVASAADVARVDLDDLLDDVRAAGRLAAMLGTGVAMGSDGLVAEWLRWALLVVTGSVDRPGGMRCNAGHLFPLEGRRWAPAPAAGHVEPGPASRPDLGRWAGQHPCAALADEIEAGTLRALVVAGGNPLTAFPDAARTRRALEALDVLAVLDVVSNDLTAIATHVLPVAGQLERADLPMSEGVAFSPGSQHTAAVVGVGADRRPAWWVLAGLGRRLGLDLLGGDADPDAVDDAAVLARFASGARGGLDAVVAAGPRGVPGTVQHGWVHERVLPGGRWRLAPEVLVARLVAPEAGPRPRPRGLVLVPHRVVGRVNSTGYTGAAGPAPLVHLHPLDAAAAGVVDGARVRVASASGSLVARVRVDDRRRPGVVTLGHGATDPNVGALTSAVDGLDPLTGMVLQSGLDVTVAPVPGAAPDRDDPSRATRRA